MYRFIFDGEGEIDSASMVLDENNIPYYFDSGDRIMVTKEYARDAMIAWDETGIDYYEI